MNDTNSFEGRTVLVTGGGTGIGRATARRFAAEGARVLVVGRTAERLRETAEGHPRVTTFTADVAAPEGPAAIAAAARTGLGRVDVLVNNAAITRPARLGAIDRTVAERQLATNLLGPIFLAQQVVPHMPSGGCVVNVSSNPPHHGWPGNSVYGSTKVALDFLTSTWAVELAPRGIRVVSVAPGITATPVMHHAGLTEAQVAELGEGLRDRIPLRRLARPEEIAWWIAAAARSEAGYLTGTVVRVDGGLSAGG